MTPNINVDLTVATHREMARAGLTWTVLPSATGRTRKASYFGVKPSANKKGAARKTLAKANEQGRGTMRNS